MLSTELKARITVVCHDVGGRELEGAACIMNAVEVPRPSTCR